MVDSYSDTWHIAAKPRGTAFYTLPGGIYIVTLWLTLILLIVGCIIELFAKNFASSGMYIVLFFTYGTYKLYLNYYMIKGSLATKLLTPTQIEQLNRIITGKTTLKDELKI